MISTDHIVEFIGKEVFPSEWKKRAFELLNSSNVSPVYSSPQKANAKQELITVQIHEENASKSNADILGFERLITALDQIKDSDLSVNLVGYKNPEILGKFYFTDDFSKFLGGLLIKKSSNRSLKTPPNWDGTQEMLEKYNTLK